VDIKEHQHPWLSSAKLNRKSTNSIGINRSQTVYYQTVKGK